MSRGHCTIQLSAIVSKNQPVAIAGETEAVRSQSIIRNAKRGGIICCFWKCRRSYYLPTGYSQARDVRVMVKLSSSELLDTLNPMSEYLALHLHLRSRHTI